MRVIGAIVLFAGIAVSLLISVVFFFLSLGAETAVAGSQAAGLACFGGIVLRVLQAEKHQRTISFKATLLPFLTPDNSAQSFKLK